MEVNYVHPVVEIGYILNNLLADRVSKSVEIPEDVSFETAITRTMSSKPDDLEKFGEPTMLTCPECGGVVRKVTTDVVDRYHCYTGHSFTDRILERPQIERLEGSLWIRCQNDGRTQEPYFEHKV